MKMRCREEIYDRDAALGAGPVCRAGKLPEAEANGARYLKLPITLESR